MGQQSSNPYTGQSISGYNATFAPDDGTEVDGNKIKLSTLVSNVAGPIKTLAEAINTQLVAALSSVVSNGDDVLNQMTGTLAFGSSELTIASGAIAPTRSHHSVDTESDASSDFLDTLTIGSNYAGTIVRLRAESGGRTVTIRHNQDNIKTAYSDNYALDDAFKWIEFMLVGSTWLEVSRSHSVPLVRSYLAGMGLSNGTDADHDIDIAAGTAVDNDTGALIVLNSALTKQIDAAWAVGDDQGGLDTGTVANDTTYHIFAIRRSDTGVVDALFSTSASSPTMPSNYDQKRRIGAVITNGSANIRAFIQKGDTFLWDTPANDYAASDPGTDAVLATLDVPTGIQVDVIFNVALQQGDANANNAYFSSPDQSDVSPLLASGLLDIRVEGSDSAAAQLIYRTNTSAQVRYHLGFSNGNTDIDISSVGWVDRRGRDD